MYHRFFWNSKLTVFLSVFILSHYSWAIVSTYGHICKWRFELIREMQTRYVIRTSSLFDGITSIRMNGQKWGLAISYMWLKLGSWIDHDLYRYLMSEIIDDLEGVFVMFFVSFVIRSVVPPQDLHLNDLYPKPSPQPPKPDWRSSDPQNAHCFDASPLRSSTGLCRS